MSQPSVTCQDCGSPKVTHLDLVLADGTAVDFTSCRICERRHWSRHGVDLNAEDVIARSRRSS